MVKLWRQLRSRLIVTQASERTRTAEELTALEAQRLEALEAQRLKRMQAAAADEDHDKLDEEGDVAVAAGGYAARRQKRHRQLQRTEAGPSGDVSSLNAVIQSVTKEN
jgi:hypothetical protein